MKLEDFLDAEGNFMDEAFDKWQDTGTMRWDATFNNEDGEVITFSTNSPTECREKLDLIVELLYDFRDPKPSYDLTPAQIDFWVMQIPEKTPFVQKVDWPNA